MKTKIKMTVVFVLGAVLATAVSLHAAMMFTPHGEVVYYGTHGVPTINTAITSIAQPTQNVTAKPAEPRQEELTARNVSPEEARLRSIEARLSALEAKQK